MSKYVLALQSNHKKLKINVKNKNYYIYVDSQREIFYPPKDDFKIKEKLYILSQPLHVVWIRIPNLEYEFFKIFNSFIKPSQLVIRPINGKVIVAIKELS